MENKVTLYGASGHCKVIIDILQKCNIKIDLIFDDYSSKTNILGYEILKTNQIEIANSNNMIISIGNNKVRKRLANQLNSSFATAIHPNALISKHITIGEGTVIMAGVIINPDTKIGKHCIINSGAIIEHDCIIEDFAHISPNAALAGGVEVGEGSHIGIGSSVIQGIKIGKWATVGAGAVIIKNVPDYAVVVGNPGKIIKYKKENE
jgi:acetyltransferase EpsM